MKTIGLNELEAHLGEILRQVQENREPIRVTSEGKAIALVMPVALEDRQAGETWTDLQPFVDEISDYLPEYVDAVEAVREIRG